MDARYHSSLLQMKPFPAWLCWLLTVDWLFNSSGVSYEHFFNKHLPMVQLVAVPQGETRTLLPEQVKPRRRWEVLKNPWSLIPSSTHNFQPIRLFPFVTEGIHVRLISSCYRNIFGPKILESTLYSHFIIISGIYRRFHLSYIVLWLFSTLKRELCLGSGCL